MDVLQLLNISPLIIAALYFVLLIVAFIKRPETNTLVIWILGYLIVSILWQTSIFIFGPATQSLTSFPITLNLVAALCLMMATTAYLEQNRPIYWFVVGIVLTAAISGIRVLAPLQLEVNNSATGLQLPTSAADLGLLIMWVLVMGTAYIWTYRSYRNTQFPWHANRHLFWANTMLASFLGELVLWIDSPIAWLVGNTIRFLATISFIYAISTYIRFDVRARFNRAIALMIITITAALPAAGIFYLFTLTEDLMSQTTAFIVIIVGATILFAVYQPYRQWIDKFVYRFLIGNQFQTNTLVRNYNQAISRTVDLDQLAIVIFSQLGELFDVRRGALMLVTKTKRGYDIEPIPAVGDISRDKERVYLDSPFIKALTENKQPLLQYEIDFDPANISIRHEMQKWFNTLKMELYVPIQTDTELQAFIAVGPKSSGLTYRPNELEAIQLLADQTVVALQNARLYSQLGSQNDTVRHLNEDLVRQNERLGTMDKVKSDFITIASHELRTPLTQIKGYSDILSAMNEENALTREQTREIVNHIERASTRLEGLISAMLDASQIDVDEMHLTFVDTNIETILRMAAEPLKRPMINRGLKYEVISDENIPNMQADFKRLAQAFRNILGNAVKYTPDGGSITVHVKYLRETDDPQLEIAIADTGIGIDSKNQELIFEKFYRVGDPQLHSTGSTKFMGAGPGLGLPISRGVIEGHRGRVWVESAGEDKERYLGSTFYIVIPLNPQKGGDIESSLPEELTNLTMGNNGSLVGKTADGEEEERPSWLIG